MKLAAVFTVSLTALCYEVLLTRFFSFSQWNHLSFMVISIVLFGFGASGSVLSLVERRRPGWSAVVLDSRGLLVLLVLCSLATSGSFLLVKNIPLDYFRMPLEWRQAVYLFLTFLILIVPFFCAGSVISLAFAGMPGQAGWIYFANMSGSAAGAVLPALLLPLLGEGRVVLCCALLLLLVPCLCALGGFRELERAERASGLRIPAVSALLMLLTCLPLAFRGGALLEIRPSPYKLLPQVLQFPETAVVSRSNTIRGRLYRLESPYIRFAPGLSLRYSGGLPPASFLVEDGDGLFVLYDLADDRSAAFSRFLHSYAGYAVRADRSVDRVLILQAGGGLSLPCAAAAGARNITLLVEHPEASVLYRERYAAGSLSGGALPAGSIPATPAVRVVSGNLRRRVARDRHRYDRIQVEAWGPSVPGMASLDQEHLLTVEAFTDYLLHLKPEGVLILSRKLLLPPSDMVKIFAAAYIGLQEAGIEDPIRHILLLRGWDSYTLLASPSAFDEAAVNDLRGFCRRRNFDPVFFEGIEEEEANRFNSFPQAFHFQEIRSLSRALSEDRGRVHFREHYLNIAPARDDHPFHSRFTRLLKLKALFRSTGSRFYSLFLSGETIVLAVLGIAGLLGVFLLLLPRLLLRRRRPTGEVKCARSGGAILYFLAAGSGFMFAEMAFLQSYTFVFGNPVIAFTVVLAELLVLSGIGGAVSARWTRRKLPAVLLILVVCQILLFAFFDPLQQRLLRASPTALALGSFGLLAPIALLMGVPFPVGLRLLVSSPRMQAFGWGANGVASVLASILAILLTMVWSIGGLLLLAALCYTLMLGVSILRD
jgi:hypothetical protein